MKKRHQFHFGGLDLLDICYYTFGYHFLGPQLNWSPHFQPLISLSSAVLFLFIIQRLLLCSLQPLANINKHRVQCSCVYMCVCLSVCLSVCLCVCLLRKYLKKYWTKQLHFWWEPSLRPREEKWFILRKKCQGVTVGAGDPKFGPYDKR